MSSLKTPLNRQLLSSRQKPKGHLELVCISVWKLHHKLAMVVACVALGTLLTLLLFLAFNQAPPGATDEHASTAEAHLLRLQASHARSAESSIPGVTETNSRDTKGGRSHGFLGLWWGGSQKKDRQKGVSVLGQGVAAGPGTLVLYIFSNTDQEYINNFRFFVRHGMRDGDGCEYVVVVNTGDGFPVRPCLLCGRFWTQ